METQHSREIIDTTLTRLQSIKEEKNKKLYEYINTLRHKINSIQEMMEVVNEKDFISKSFEYDINKWSALLNDTLYQMIKLKTLSNSELNTIVERFYEDGKELFGHWENEIYVTRHQEVTTNKTLRWHF